ncbi:MAG: lantibiotic dehydratase family protein [Nitrososphaeraceae archaeon]
MSNNLSYILRTPLLPVSDTDNMSIEKLKELITRLDIQEAIKLSSPYVYDELVKYLNGDIKSEAKQVRLELTLLKYLSRMSHRCTPFGLFAGCSVGKFGNKNSVWLKQHNEFKRQTRFDMTYLCALSRETLNNKKNHQNNCKYFPNTSLYQVGNYWRYVEIRYSNNRRNHFIVSIEHSEYIGKVLKLTEGGCTYDKLVNTLICKDINYSIAKAFIEDLIINQVIVSELEPGITGDGGTYIMLNNLEKYSPYRHLLQEVNLKLKKIDQSCIGDSIPIYDEISNILSGFGVKFDKQFLFQTDLVPVFSSNTIHRDVYDDILKGVQALKKLNVSWENPNLKSFKNAFLQRYEDEEVSLSNVLDVEFGIGYPPTELNSPGDISNLVDDLVLSGKNTFNSEFKTNKVFDFLHEKYAFAIARCEDQIVITDKDLDFLNVKKVKMASTYLAIAEIVSAKENDDFKIKITEVGGATAAAYLGRFCYADTDIERYVRDITSYEEKKYTEAIIAEIAHLPESRTGNILLRPHLRRYEIPYLANSYLDEENQIPISDLMVSIRNDRIILRSKKHSKEVVTRLSTAHDFESNSLPIYHFLCDLQFQEIENSISFNWGPYADSKLYLPRVIYNNIILHPATWNLRKRSINTLVSRVKQQTDPIRAITEWKKTLKIPDEILIVEGDNELYVDLSNSLYIKLFLDIIQKKKNIKLREYLYNSQSYLVKRNLESFTNQLIVSLQD